MRRHRLKKGLKNKFKNLSFFKKNLLVMMASLVLVCFTMVGYAALNQTLNITGDLIIRADKDIRITDLKLVGDPVNAYEQYNSKYTVDTISVFPAFESGNGSISYQATITNKGSTDMEITNINKELSDSSINCSIIGLYKETIIEAGTTKTFTINLTGSNNTSEPKSVGLLLEITWDEYYEKYLTYNISGNSIQNGTPSPSTPVAIESVGEKTSNLYNLHSTDYCARNSYSLQRKPKIENNILYNGGISGTSEGAGLYFKIKKNTDYILSYDLDFDETTETSRIILISLFNDIEDGITTNETIKYLSKEKGKLVYKFNSGDNEYFTFFSYSNTQYGMSFSNLYLGEQEEYEPYGYKIPIEVSGKNLFNIDDLVNGTILKNNNDGTYDLVLTSDGRFTSYVDFYIPANTTFTISLEMLEYTGELPQAFNVRYKLKDGTVQYSNFRTTYTSMKHKFTSDVIQIQLYAAGGNAVDSYTRFRNLQIEIGDTVTEYVPYVEPTIKNIYLDEPLRKVGDCETCADNIDFATGKLVRNIATTDTSNIQLVSFKDYPTLWYGYARGTLPGAINSSINKIQSDKFLTRYPRNVNNLGTSHLFNDEAGYPEVVYYNVLKTDVPDVTDMAGLQEWFRNLDAEIHYVLATPITTDIELPEIIKKPYYTTVNVKTSVEPSDVTYSFVSK